MKRATSEFFHFHVSRGKAEPSDASFRHFLASGQVRDYYHRALHTRGHFDRERDDPVQVTNQILHDYDFIGITERMEESLVALMMLLDLRMADVLHLSAKFGGGYDDEDYGCAYIWPSFISTGMQAFFGGERWNDIVRNDSFLYRAANRSLDLTIERLGREEFEGRLARFRRAQQEVFARCLPEAVFPCDGSGEFNPPEKTDCLWKDSGCGTSCLDGVATELGLW
jgi:hypothetical protein